MRERVPAGLRRAVLSRDGCACRYCGRLGNSLGDPDGSPWHLDHDVPASRGGRSNLENLLVACAKCNLAKYALTGDEFRRRLQSRAPAERRPTGSCGELGKGAEAYRRLCEAVAALRAGTEDDPRVVEMMRFGATRQEARDRLAAFVIAADRRDAKRNGGTDHGEALRAGS